VETRQQTVGSGPDGAPPRVRRRLLAFAVCFGLVITALTLGTLMVPSASPILAQTNPGPKIPLPDEFKLPAVMVNEAKAAPEPLGGILQAQGQNVKKDAPKVVVPDLPKAPIVLPDVNQIQEPVVPILPPPQMFGPHQFRLPFLGNTPKMIGGTPRPTTETVQRYNKYVKEMVDPEMTLELVQGQTRLMVFKQVPKRIQIADDYIAGYTLLETKELSLLGRNVGSTVLTFWFVDPKDGKESILTYQVKVLPDPEYRVRLDRVYKALAEEINRSFPNSVVNLAMVGDKLVLSGHAKDIADAAHILRIVRANAPMPYNNQPRARDTARIPFDRQKAGRDPNDPVQGEPVPPGLDEYELGNSHPYIINLLRINGEQQVMLRVTVAEVNRAAARSIGLNFTIFNAKGQAVFSNQTGSILTGGITQTGFAGSTIVPLNLANGAVQGAGAFNNLNALLDNGQVQLAISALRDLNYARSLAEPTLVTLNGQTANFQAGGQFPVPVVAGYTNVGLQGVNFVPYGVQLAFTPYITDRDRVRLQINANVSSRDLAAGMTNIGGTGVPTLSTRNFQTTVEMREGQTLAVAGLIQNNLGADSKRVPFFGDLPFFGRAFAFDRVNAGEQELIILITPVLVHPMERKEVPPLPGSDLIEPSDLEFYLHGRLESRYGVDYRSPVRTDWHRITNFRRYERLYLSGPSGPCDE
jgi:pilus assembly protein CpaC